MPLCTRRSQASVTFYGSIEPSTAGNSKCTNIHSFRELPSYPTPQQRKEITSTATTSSFQTSYVMNDQVSTISEADTADLSDISRLFWRDKTLIRNGGKFNFDDSSDEDTYDTVNNDASSCVTYDTIDDVPCVLRERKEVYCFNVEGTGAILSITLAQPGQSWITRFNNKTIYLYHRNGNKKETKTISEKLGLLVKREDKTVLAVPDRSQTIFKMSSSGKLAKFVSFELEIGGMCCTSRSETLLTTRFIQKSQKKGPKPKNVPSVLRLNQMGEIIWCITAKGGERFVNPARILVNVNGDIVLIDNEPSRAHVVILSPDGEEKKRYYGTGHSTLNYDFEPKYICCDSKGNIYIADLHNSVVHVLDKTGSFSYFLFTKADGYQYPVAIASEPDGFVWVGFSSGIVRIFQIDK